MANYRRIPLDRLFIDERYQREQIPGHAERIAADYDESMLGVLEVNDRGKGRFAVYDGQHRFLALTILGAKDAPCLVHVGMSAQEEAELFTALQKGRRNLSKKDEFYADLFSRKQWALDVDRAVSENGFTFGGATASGRHLGAFGALKAVYKRFGYDGLHTALSIARVWQDGDKAIHGTLVEGIALFLRTVEGPFDIERLRDRLAVTPPEALAFRAFQAAARSGGGGSRSRANYFADEILTIYNNGLRSKSSRIGRKAA